MNARKVLLLNGPNLGRLGKRRTEIYGRHSLMDVQHMVSRELSLAGLDLVAFQSNAEAALIDRIEEHADAVGTLVNPGALMIYGWGLRDALEEFSGLRVEVHISNIWARECFRQHSILAPVCDGVIAGLGTDGYALAARWLVQQLTEHGS